MNFDDEVRALLILCSLPQNWNSLVMVVSNCVPSSNTLKFVGVILSEEMRRKSTCETSGNALTMERRGRKRERGIILGNCMARDLCHATPHRKIFMIIFQVIFDMFYWEMMNHVKLLERVR